MVTIRTDQLKQVCIKPECESEEFTDLFDKNGVQYPAKKCVSCGTISTMFKSKL